MPKLFASLLCWFIFTEGSVRFQGWVNPGLRKRYLFGFVDDVLDGLVHLFGFGEELADFAFLFNLFAIH